MGTSFVEEEHQTVYFLLNSLHMGLILKIIIQKSRGTIASGSKGNEYVVIDDLHDRRELTGPSELPTKVAGPRDGVHTYSVLEKLRRSPNKLILLLVISFSMSRLMRSWNSTGDKWAHLEDLGDGIRAMGDVVVGLVLLLGLAVLVILLSHNCLPLVLVTCVCIFGRHFPYWGTDISSGVFEAQLAHLMIIVIFVYGLFKAKLVEFKSSSKSQKLLDVYEPEEEKISTVLRYSYTAGSLLCILLQRPDNVGLMSLVLLQNWLLSSVIYRLTLIKCISHGMAAFAVNWLAFAHFFYQVSCYISSYHGVVVMI